MVLVVSYYSSFVNTLFSSEFAALPCLALPLLGWAVRRLARAPAFAHAPARARAAIAVWLCSAAVWAEGSSFRTLWALLCFAGSLFYALAIPFLLGYQNDKSFAELAPWIAVSYFVDIFFYTDLAFDLFFFRDARQSADEEVGWRELFAEHWSSCGAGLVTAAKVCALLPVDLIGLGVSPLAWCGIRVLRLLKMLQFLDHWVLLEKWYERRFLRVSKGTARIVQLAVLASIICFFFGALFNLWDCPNCHNHNEPLTKDVVNRSETDTLSKGVRCARAEWSADLTRARACLFVPERKRKRGDVISIAQLNCVHGHLRLVYVPLRFAFISIYFLLFNLLFYILFFSLFLHIHFLFLQFCFNSSWLCTWRVA